MKKSLGLLTSMMSSFKFIMNSMSFFWAIYYISLGFSGLQIGILFATTTITSLLLTIPTGITNDRVTPKRLIQFGTIILITEFILLSYTQNFYHILALILIGSFGAQIFMVSVDSLFYKTSGDQKPINRIKTYVSFYLLAAGLGVAFGGQLLGDIEFQKYFLIIAGLFGLILGMSFFLPKTDTIKLDIGSYKTDIFKPHILLFIAIIFSFAIHMGSELTSYGPFLKDNLGLTFPQMGLYMGVAIMCMFLSVRLTARALDNGASIRKIVTIGLLASGIGYLVMLHQYIPISFLGRLLHEAGDAMMFVFLYAGVAQFFKKERIGGNSGLITFTQSSGIFISSLIFAPLGENFGHEVPIIISGVTTLLAILLLKEYEYHFNRNAG